MGNNPKGKTIMQNQEYRQMKQKITAYLLDCETKGVFVEDICANTVLINKMTDIAIANNLKASDSDINETIHAIVATDKQHEYDKTLFQKLFDYTSLAKYQNSTTAAIIARIKDLLTCLPHTYLCLCIDGYAGAISIENISEKTTIISNIAMVSDVNKATLFKWLENNAIAYYKENDTRQKVTTERTNT